MSQFCFAIIVVPCLIVLVSFSVTLYYTNTNWNAVITYVYIVSDDFLPHYNEHGKSEFECRYCLLPFSDSAQVMKHENTHQKERPFPCLMCPILFKSYHQREFHEMVHRNENCLLCSICGQAFTHHDRLKLHNQNIHHIHLELT